MARYKGSVCRLCRREGLKLFLKGTRCVSSKCAIEQRNFAPGQFGLSRVKVKEYGTQLREKQKVKRLYGVLEKQFRIYFKRADRAKGVTGTNLIVILESRFDSVLSRAGLVTSKVQSRQVISHNHLTLNGKKVNIPSILLKEGDVIRVKEKSRNLDIFKSAIDNVIESQIPEWLALDKNEMSITLLAAPTRDSVRTPIQERFIVELYSK
ncbi:MAG: 30S ribosomal protein S4 [Nitrospinota bacterium]